MTSKQLPSPELVRRLIDYNPKTGRMFWRERPNELFNSDRDWRWWNTRYGGMETATRRGPGGYRIVKIFDAQILAQRVAWAHFYGCWPPQIVVLKNHDPADIRIRNLRSCSRSACGKNHVRRRIPTDGVNGIGNAI